MFVSALLIHGVPIECINKAAITYYVPASVIIAVLNTESASTGAAVKNSNGTMDYGAMQINSVWLPKLAPYGYTAQKLQFDPCANVMAGAWILSQRIAGSHSPYYWQGVGNYHSYSFGQNWAYQNTTWANYLALQKALHTPIRSNDKGHP